MTNTTSSQRPAFAAIPALTAVLALLALVAPMRDAEEPLSRVGVLLALAGALELLHSLRRADPAALRRGVISGSITTLMAFLVISVPYLAGTALTIFIAGSFALDAVGYLRDIRRGDRDRTRQRNILAAAGDLVVAAALLLLRGRSINWLVTIAASLRMLGIAWRMATSRVLDVSDAGAAVVDDLGLGGRPEAAALREQVAAEEQNRASIDRGWMRSFILILFSIHIARMQVDGSLLGYVAPAIAVVGDMFIATLVFLFVMMPVTISIRGSTVWIERLVWRWYLEPGDRDRWLRRIAQTWLKYRLRMATRLREVRYSVPALLRRGLITGLPAAAVIAASVPIWGMSWFFDTENWASGMWNSWAESRTDEWRAAMIPAVAGPAGVTAATFALSPPGTAAGDFSFIVIGDTGEGDASQQVLRDQLLTVSATDDVKFVVISSDVIYPNGSMVDYEDKFWLQFKGVTKPVYAIPGNHDWYDALEAFLATFLQPDAARAAMQARAEADLRLTSSTNARFDDLIATAGRLRHDYQVPTGFQRGPFFEIQTDRFALVAIDTGVAKRIDDRQWAWLESALGRAVGKTTMAVVGHPFYAGGHDMTVDDDDFARLKQLLLRYDVPIMMAGDTHDLEYYFDPPAGGAKAVHYFVNGGGGAYLSFGTSMQWPATPPTREWAYYPNKPDVVKKIDARTPWWKRPAWWWTTQFNAWPFSSEWLSGAFDYNVSPFFQSFFEVRVEPSRHQIRLWPYGIHGRLRWHDLAHSQDLGAGKADEPVEWTVPLR